MQYTVSEAAALVGVSARVLRHYDEIGLLQPSERSDAGYRLYSETDVQLLQRVVAYRDMGMGLEDIRNIINADSGDALEVLEQQEAVLQAALTRVTNQLDAVSKTRKARKMGINLNPDEMQEVFGEHDPTEYQEEAEQRWGETDAYKESNRRVAQYSKADWERHAVELEEIESGFAAAMLAGLSAESDAAKASAERHRLQIDTWFYPCSHEMQSALAEMYIADARFAKHYNDRAEGLAQYVRDAIIANALDHI